MAKKSLATWKRKVLTGSYKVDLDNQSYDCVDVPKDWMEYLTDVSWTKSAGWGNAKDIYANWSRTYLDAIPRGNAPKLGDIVVMNGQVGGGYGHTGVVIAIDGRNIQIAQQNTFTQQAVYTGWFDAYASYITGFLRPKVDFSEGDQELQPYQRIVTDGGVYYRKEPKKAGEQIQLFAAGDVVDFKGFVRGESVDGNNIWFVGRYTGFYSWSGGYKDSGTHDLTDMTPATETPLTDTQRKVGADAMNVRTSAKLDTVNNNVSRLLQPGTVIDVKGYVIGQNVDGNDRWFVLTDGTYTWSGGYTNQDTSKLANLTPQAPVDPTPTQPTDPTPTTPTVPDPLVTAVINKKHPNTPIDYAPTDLVSVGNGQTMRKEAAEAMGKMQTAAIAAGAQLTMGSGYRSYATQQTVYGNYVKQDGQEKADTYSARPGFSEHQTGLTMDFSPIADTFAQSKQFTWLMANAHLYGFVLRYAADKTAITGYTYEPWHWRYVGVAAATEMHNKGIRTLEEFYNVPGGLYAGQDPVTPTDPTPTDPKPTDPTIPVTPPEPPAPTDEAAKSATAFVARITSQLVAAGIIVNGLAGILKSYAALTFDATILGVATLVVAVGMVGYSQYKYKKTGGQKGWFF